VSPSISQRLAAEFIATAGLLAAVVGSGIMGESLAGGNVAIALLANTMATAAALVALILTFGPISGAHMNPVVTLVAVLEKRLASRDAAGYLVVQVLGAIAGVWLAHVMFDKPILMTSERVRSGVPQLVSEAVATFGLIFTILGTVKYRPAAIPFAVAAYIAAAYWSTASTSFANPAVTVARSLTNTFAGIRPVDAPGFIAAQLVGAMLALTMFRWLSRSNARV
jgi:glycerol uptake facilitator-like aquaporin